jgi:hypothetical protein
MNLRAAILAAMLALLFFGCGTDAPTATDATAWNREQFRNYFGLSDEQVQYFIDIGIFDPDDTCTAQVNVLPQRTLHGFQLFDQEDTGLDVLMWILARIHTTVPELYIDTGNTYTFDYEVTADNIDRLLDDARAGKAGRPLWRICPVCSGLVAV